MNKITNILVLLVTLPIMAILIFIGRDLPIEPLKTTGAQLPFQTIIFWVMASIVFLIISRRSVKRWTGLQLIGKTGKFIWNQEVSLERKKRIVLYNALESFALLCISIGLYKVCPAGWPIALAYGIGVFDEIIFTIFAWFKKGWRIGFTKKALILSDREVKAVYFLGLRKIYIHHETLHFDFIKDLQLNIPFGAVEDKEGFIQTLWANLNQDKVFAEESVKEYLKSN
jgi:hypothetical protein